MKQRLDLNQKVARPHVGDFMHSVEQASGVSVENDLSRLSTYETPRCVLKLRSASFFSAGVLGSDRGLSAMSGSAPPGRCCGRGGSSCVHIGHGAPHQTVLIFTPFEPAWCVPHGQAQDLLIDPPKHCASPLPIVARMRPTASSEQNISLVIKAAMPHHFIPVALRAKLSR
jgi:hypothetical protein